MGKRICPTCRAAGAVVVGLAVMLLVVGGARTAPGDFDPSFGGDGIVTTEWLGPHGGGMVMQPGGKIIVADGTFVPDAGLSYFMLARYNPDGSLDTSFGGDGTVTTEFGPGGAVAHDVALQPDGRIVATGETDIDPDPAWQHNVWALARYDEDGELDTTFGDAGKVTTEFGTGNHSADSVALRQDGKIVVAASTWNGADYDFVVARYTIGGSLDPTFGGDGMVTTDFAGPDGATDVAVQANGRVVAAGTSAEAFALARYDENGSLDTSFGGDGRVTTAFGSGARGDALALGADGKIVAAGMAYADLGSDFALARYDENGSLDTSFGGDGRVTTDVGTNVGWEFTASVALEATGKTVAGGPTGYPEHDFALTRYTADGSLDPSFSGDGVLITDFGFDDYLATVALQADGKIVAHGRYTREGMPESTALARYIGGDDITPPETTIDSGPSELTNDSTPTFAFSSNEAGSTFECRVDTGSFAACSSPHTTDPLIDGPHTFAVRAVDRSLNRDATPAARSFTVDTVVPETTIVDGPAGVTNDSTPTFVFSSSEPEATLRCRIDSGAFATCTSPYTTDVLADGPHTFAVYASDAAGNADATPASRFFVVDTTAPETVLEGAPSGPTNDATPTFVFSSEQGASFACRFASDAFRPCSSPHTPGVLADGMYTFEVRATDLVGNTDATPAGATWTIDTKVPAFTLSGRRAQKVGGKLIVSVRAVSEHVWATVSGRISIRAPVRSLRGPRNKLVARGRTVLIPLYMPRGAQTAIRQALRRGKVVRGTVRVRGRDIAGNVTTRRLTVRITR